MRFAHLPQRSAKLIIWLIVCLSSVTRAQDAGEQIRAAVSAASASVVRIRVIGGEQTVDGATVSSLATTGVVISPAGQIVSSSFAFQGRPTAVSVETSAGERRSATLVATDHVRRLVLLQAEGAGWSPATVVPRDQLQVGQHALALGRFYESSVPSVSSGIVSALNRIHGRALQTDAKISPVNYGGPLIDLAGGVLGILVPLSPRGRGNPSSGIEWYDSGIGFAVPMSDVVAVAEKLTTGKDLRPGLAGLQLTAPGPFSEKVSVQRIHPGSPAQTAGIRVGDRLLQAADLRIQRLSSLEEVLASRYAGDSVELTLERDGQPVKVQLQLVEQLPTLQRGYAGLILPAAAVTPNPVVPAIADPQALLNPQPAPAVPVSVQTIPDSPAARAGLPTTFELTAVNNKPLKGLRSFQEPDLQLLADSEVDLKWRDPQTGEERSLKMKPGVFPPALPATGPALLNGAEPQPAPGSQTPSREEVPIEGLGSCVVISPAQSSGRRVAPIVLLSADTQSEADLVERWGPLLAEYRLMLLIPRTTGRTSLTADDAPIVLACLQLAASKYNADSATPILLAAAPQTELAWQFTSGNSRVTADLVLQTGWISDFLLQEVNGTGQSVLLLENSQKPESRLLLDRSRTSLRKAGFWVPAVSQERPVEQQIAAWSVLLRAW